MCLKKQQLAEKQGAKRKIACEKTMLVNDKVELLLLPVTVEPRKIQVEIDWELLISGHYCAEPSEEQLDHLPH